MVVGKDCGRGWVEAEMTGDAGDPVRPAQLPVGPDDEAAGCAIEQHAAARPFVVVRPERGRRNAGSPQVAAAAARESGPVVGVASFDRQHFAVGGGFGEGDGMGDEGGAVVALDHPEQADPGWGVGGMCIHGIGALRTTEMEVGSHRFSH